MEREFDYEVVNGQVMSQIQPYKEIQKDDEKIDMELADVVYIFYSKDKPGIKFYDRKPNGAEAKVAGTVPKGVFLTDIYSINEAIWDEKLNEENNSYYKKVYDGSSIKISTIMVSREQFMKISQGILEASDPERIKIDTRNMLKFDYEDFISKENINRFCDTDKNVNKFKL